MSAHGHGATPALRALDAAGIRYRVFEYEHDPRAASFGMEAAALLGFDPATVCKTLMAAVDGTPAVAVVPVDARLDLKAFARALGGKNAAMMSPDAATRATGYVPGGISPFGQRRRHRCVVDTTASALAVVHVSGGRRGLNLELDPADLIALTDAVVAPIARR